MSVKTYEEYHLSLAGMAEPMIFLTENDAISYMQDVTTPGVLKKVIYSEKIIRVFNAGEITPALKKFSFKDVKQIGIYKVKEG